MWAQLINAILGLWLMVAPEILGFNKIMADNNHITGPVIATFAITAIFECTRPVRKFNMLMGVWLIVSPFVLDYSQPAALINNVAVGAMVIGFSLVKGRVSNRFGGGWSGLWKPNSLHETEAARKII